jgi:hypothetical protein
VSHQSSGTHEPRAAREAEAGTIPQTEGMGRAIFQCVRVAHRYGWDSITARTVALLILMRQRYLAGELTEYPIDRHRLEFARYLYQSGRLKK